jgi:plastocyanin
VVKPLVAMFSMLAAASATSSAVDVSGTVTSGGKRLANAVVWLESSVRLPPRETAPAVMDQRNLRFAPRVLAVQAGTTVDFPNSDRVFHNVFSFKDGKKFDLGLYPVGATKLVQFDRPGVSRLFCNIHPNMAAYVVAVDSPYYAVSEEDGTFVLPDVPPGSYTFHAWSPGAPDMRGAYVVDPGRPLEIRWP